MIVERLSSSIDIQKQLKALNVDAGGVAILSKKAKIYIIRIKELHVGGANILKQDALSIGADLAVPRGTVIAQTPQVDCLLIATKSQLEKLSKKELAQPFGLKELAKKLSAIASSDRRESAEVMGVINANDDSFFSKSRFVADDAIAEIENMIAEGASIIDIGGVSSAPNAKPISAEEELSRVRPILDVIAKERLYERVTFSIDSYAPKVIEYALQSGFKIVNDITGLSDDGVCEICAKYKARVVIMHMQGTPETMQVNPNYENTLDEIYTFFEERIEKAKRFGIEEIVLDVGIGFGKRVEDNISLIKNLEHFKTLGYPLLVGASRKSMIDKIDPSDVSKRLGGTLAIHLEAFRNGASILRVHDVQEHAQALKVQLALDGF